MTRRARSRFKLSAEAAALVLDGSGRWEHVQLSDGDAAQAMVPGVRARPPIAEALPVLAEEELPDPNQIALPGLD